MPIQQSNQTQQQSKQAQLIPLQSSQQFIKIPLSLLDQISSNKFIVPLYLYSIFSKNSYNSSVYTNMPLILSFFNLSPKYNISQIYRAFEFLRDNNYINFPNLNPTTKLDSSLMSYEFINQSQSSANWIKLTPQEFWYFIDKFSSELDMPSAINLYVYMKNKIIASNYFKTECCEAMDKISANLGISKPTTIKLIKALESNDLISVTKKHISSSKDVNIYSLKKFLKE